MSAPLATADFGSITVFYRYELPEPARHRPHGESEKPVPASASLVKIVVGQTDITKDCGDLFGDDWTKIEERLVEDHEAYLRGERDD